MAATANKYSQQADCTVVNGERKILALIPLALQKYGNAAKFKQLFYLDDVEFCKDFQGNNCVRGLVQQGSANAAMHAGKRRGVLMRRKEVAAEDWQSYNLLNDGGLNTFADCDWVNTKGTPNGEFLALFANYICVTCRLASAYYVDTTSIQIRLRIPAKSKEWNITIPTGVPGGGLPARQEIAVLAAELKDLDIEENDWLYLSVSATNAEGTYTYPTELDMRADAPAVFLTVYRWDSLPSPTTDPREGTPYIMILSAKAWAAGAGGIFNELFQEDEDVDIALSGGERIKGGEGTDVSPALLNTRLPDGFYFGVPTTYQGSDFKIVRVSANGFALAWYENQQSPPPPQPGTYTRVSTIMEYTDDGGGFFTITIKSMVVMKEGETLPSGVEISVTATPNYVSGGTPVIDTMPKRITAAGSWVVIDTVQVSLTEEHPEVRYTTETSVDGLGEVVKSEASMWLMRNN